MEILLFLQLWSILFIKVSFQPNFTWFNLQQLKAH